MNRRDWTVLAAVIRSERTKWRTAGEGYELGVLALDLVARRMAEVLASQNARFNVNRFLMAAGVVAPDAIRITR